MVGAEGNGIWCANFTGLLVAIALFAALAAPARAEVTAAQVNTAIANGMAYLEKQQQPAGNWTEMAAEPGGVTALCTLALLNCGRTPGDPSVKKALDYLERHDEPSRTYSTSLFIMAFAQADPKKYALKIDRLARTLAQQQVREEHTGTKGGWGYERPQQSGRQQQHPVRHARPARGRAGRRQAGRPDLAARPQLLDPARHAVSQRRLRLSGRRTSHRQHDLRGNRLADHCPRSPGGQ